MANEEQLKILKKGVRAWNEWRIANNPLIELAGASLPGIDLSSIDAFTHLNLNHANLKAIDFSKADLGGARLVNSDLTGANLNGASLSDANLWGAELDYANLIDTVLYDTDFSEASLVGTDFSNSVMDGTRFGGVDLSKAKGLNAIRHEGPGRIDLDVVYLSEGNIPESFMVGAGAPDSFITYMKSLVAQPIEYYSCFISHSSKDQHFVNLLHSRLQGEGLRVWLAAEDLKIGDRFRTKIDEAIRLHDKLLLVLSKNSVESLWVESEVEAAFEKEQKQKRTLLFPIRLDDAVMETERAWAAEIRRTRHIGDFRKWKEDGQYQKAVTRLLRDLKKSSS